MPIEVTCPGCGKQYSAPESLAGKRLACKNCGSALDVPVGGVRPSIDENSETRSAEPALRDAPRAPVAAQHASSSDTDVDSDDPLASLEPGSKPKPADVAMRYGRGFDFPHSREVDRFLPWALVVGAAVLIGYANISFTQAAQSGARPGKSWLNFLSLLMLAVSYVGIAWPLGLFLMRLGARTLHYRFPSPQKWIAFSIFALPFALHYLIWTLADAWSGYVSGMFVAIGLACGIAWALVRPSKPNTPGTLGFAAGAMVGSILLTLIVLILTNLLVFKILDELKTSYEVPRSPFGPQLAWDVTAPAQPDEKPKPTRTLIADKPADPTSIPATREAVAVAPDSIFNEVPVAHADPTTRAADPEASEENSVAMAVTDEHEPPSMFSDPKLKPDTEPQPEAEDPDALAIADTSGDKVGEFLDVLYPATPSDHMLVIRRRSPTEDGVERWNARTLTKHGEVRFRHEINVRPAYILSPAGDHLVRIVQWPQLAAQVWSFEERKVVRSIELNDGNLGASELIGFIDAERFVVLWRNGSTVGFQILNSKASTVKPRGFGVANFEPSAGNPTLSPDGRYVVLAARSEGEVQLQIYDLTSFKAIKRLRISAFRGRWPVRPSGIAFSPDGSHVAVLFQQDENALVISWKFPSGQPVAEHNYPAGELPEQTGPLPRGRVFDYLAGNNALLIYGQSVLDAAQGGKIADLTVEGGRVQRIIGGETLHVVTSPEDSDLRHLTVLKLKPDRLLKATK